MVGLQPSNIIRKAGQINNSGRNYGQVDSKSRHAIQLQIMLPQPCGNMGPVLLGLLVV